ncbi:unnamed protein product [Choristocarpus tenellus]
MRTKRPRQILTGHPQASALVDIHQVGYWAQWHLALQKACARFDAASETSGVGNCQHEGSQIHSDCQTLQQALNAEIRHLQSQLGKQASANGKIEARLSEIEESQKNVEAKRASAASTVQKLEGQIVEQRENTERTVSDLRSQLSIAKASIFRLQSGVEEADAAKETAKEQASTLAREVIELRQALQKGEQEAQSFRSELEICSVKLKASEVAEATLQKKYSAVKHRLAEAGKKVDSLRVERSGLRRECAVLEDKLADVEKFQRSERGQALDRMERELAEEKMARVELEADRDDLQTQLSALTFSSGERRL